MLIGCSALTLRAGSIFNTSGTAGCSSIDGAVGTFSCGSGEAQINQTSNGFGFYINPTYTQFGGAPAGTLVDGSHDPLNTDTPGTTCGTTFHCESLTFSETGTFAASAGAGTTFDFNWSNLSLSLVSTGAIGSWIQDYYITYTVVDNSTSTIIATYTSTPVTFTKTGSGTGSGPTTELNLTGSGSTLSTASATSGQNFTVTADLVVGWLFLGPQVTPVPATGAQGNGVDLDVKIGSGSLDLGTDSSVTPEPAALGLVGLGLALAGLLKRRV